MALPKFAELIYYGFWHSPEMQLLRKFFKKPNKTQEYVTDKVKLALYEDVITINRESPPLSFYDQKQSNMDVAGGFNPQNSSGFIKTHIVRLINNDLHEGKIKNKWIIPLTIFSVKNLC